MSVGCEEHWLCSTGAQQKLQKGVRNMQLLDVLLCASTAERTAARDKRARPRCLPSGATATHVLTQQHTAEEAAAGLDVRLEKLPNTAVKRRQQCTWSRCLWWGIMNLAVPVRAGGGRA